jgi:hypothetical protein
MSDTNPNPNPNEPTPGSADPQTKQERTFSEEFRVSGEAVLSKVKELVREGNVRRITIKNEEGRTLIEIPLTIGVIGTVLLPVWAAIGASPRSSPTSRSPSSGFVAPNRSRVATSTPPRPRPV